MWIRCRDAVRPSIVLKRISSLGKRSDRINLNQIRKKKCRSYIIASTAPSQWLHLDIAAHEHRFIITSSLVRRPTSSPMSIYFEQLTLRKKNLSSLHAIERTISINCIEHRIIFIDAMAGESAWTSFLTRISAFAIFKFNLPVEVLAPHRKLSSRALNYLHLYSHRRHYCSRLH